jgi:hypothetical protein
MGTIYKRGKTYWIQYYCHGRKFQESSRSRKKEVAKALLKAREGNAADKQLRKHLENAFDMEPEVYPAVNNILTAMFCTNPDSNRISARLRMAILKRDNERCVRCGKNGKDTVLQVDHVVPFSKGGKTVAENLQTLCRECNIGKFNIFN